MINLLPYRQKKRVAEEIRWRLLVSVFLITALAGAGLSGTLYLLNQISSDLISAEKERIDRAEAEMLKPFLRDGQIMMFNETMSELLSVYAGSADMTETFRLLHEAFPYGSHIDSIVYKRSLNEEGKVVHGVTVTGYSPQWESMLEIERGLEERFNNVSLSPGVWTRLVDIDFSISFTLR